MQHTPRVLLFESPEHDGSLLRAQLAARGMQIEAHALPGAVNADALAQADIAVVTPGMTSDAGLLAQAASVLEQLSAANVATLVCGAPDALRTAGGPMTDWLAPNASVDEVVGRLDTLKHYVPIIKRFERELMHLQRLSEQLNRYFSEIDQEMRLAGRLQRDFLPSALPPALGVEFGVIYRPASWISGDMYDVFRIDEHHLGLFMADAMGHGVAAGLLTMFLRQALAPKRIQGASYDIVTPAEALSALHACLVRQKLPNCQFVTAVYAILDLRTRELRLSRGGHPYPLHIHADGRVDQIDVGGGLLGLADLDAEFDEARVVLKPGDKLLLFTDGLEGDFLVESGKRGVLPQPTPNLLYWARFPLADLVRVVGAHLDTKEGSLHPADDMTLLGLQMEQPGAVAPAGNV